MLAQEAPRALTSSSEARHGSLFGPIPADLGDTCKTWAGCGVSSAIGAGDPQVGLVLRAE